MAAFRAPLWAWLLAACGLAVFTSLAAWQTRRGLAKERLIADLSSHIAPDEVLSAHSASPQGLAVRRAQASGTYRVELELLEDGQSHKEQPGYHVWTPLQLADGALVLVDRGWIARDAVGSIAPPPGGPVTVSGFWRSLPQPGLRLAAASNCPGEKRFPAIVLYPTGEDLHCLLGPSALAGLLLLDPERPGGFVREWSDFGFPPERHFAYAFQWALLALATVVIFYRVNRKSA